MFNTETYEQLKKVVDHLDETIEEIRTEYKDPFMMRDIHGRYVLLDALVAKTTALNTLAQMELSVRS